MNIDLPVKQRLLERRPDAGPGGEVNHDLGPGLAKDLRYPFGIADVAPVERDGTGFADLFQIFEFEFGGVEVVQIVDNRYFMAGPQVGLGEVRADKPGAAGDENSLHLDLSWDLFCKRISISSWTSDAT